MIIRDNGDYIRFLLYSCFVTTTGRGVHLGFRVWEKVQVGAVPTSQKQLKNTLLPAHVTESEVNKPLLLVRKR